MGISDIKNDHKRHFARGFMYLFGNQNRWTQAAIASEIGVRPPTITHLKKGNEKKFPRYENQEKLARFFELEVHQVVEIGMRIEQGENPDNLNLDSNSRNYTEKIDLDLFKSIMVMVDEELASSKIEADPAKKAEIILLIYNQAEAKKDIGREMVRRYLNLIT